MAKEFKRLHEGRPTGHPARDANLCDPLGVLYRSNPLKLVASTVIFIQKKVLPKVPPIQNDNATISSYPILFIFYSLSIVLMCGFSLKFYFNLLHVSF